MPNRATGGRAGSRRSLPDQAPGWLGSARSPVAPRTAACRPPVGGLSPRAGCQSATPRAENPADPCRSLQKQPRRYRRARESYPRRARPAPAAPAAAGGNAPLRRSTGDARGPRRRAVRASPGRRCPRGCRRLPQLLTKRGGAGGSCGTPGARRAERASPPAPRHRRAPQAPGCGRCLSRPCPRLPRPHAPDHHPRSRTLPLASGVWTCAREPRRASPARPARGPRPGPPPRRAPQPGGAGGHRGLPLVPWSSQESTRGDQVRGRDRPLGATCRGQHGFVLVPGRGEPLRNHSMVLRCISASLGLRAIPGLGSHPNRADVCHLPSPSPLQVLPRLYAQRHMVKGGCVILLTRSI